MSDDNKNQAAGDSSVAELYAPENCSGASFGGKSYECKGGKVRVPHEAVDALLQHGFSKEAPKRSKAEK